MLRFHAPPGDGPDPRAVAPSAEARLSVSIALGHGPLPTTASRADLLSSLTRGHTGFPRRLLRL